MKVRKALLVFLVVSLATLLLAGCGGGKPQAVKIAALGPFTGQLSKVGQDALNAINMAVDEFNESGALKGIKVEVIVGDDGADPAKATVAAEKVSADPAVVGAVGPMLSFATNAELPIMEKAKIAIISQSATNSQLTEQGFKVMHRICPRDDLMGPAAAKYIASTLGVKKVYMIDDKGSYGQGFADQVESALKKLGVTDITRGQITPEDKDFSPILTQVKAADPELLFLAIPDPAQGAIIAKQLRGMNMTCKLMGGEGLFEKDQFINAGGAAVEGTYVTNIAPMISTMPEAKAFVEKYEKKHGALSMHSGQSYEAARLLLQAIKEVYDANGGKVTREKVLDAVHNIKYKGMLGQTVSFDSKGDVTSGTVYILQVKGGDYVQVGKVEK